MKKTLILVLSLLLIVAAVSACSKNTEGEVVVPDVNQVTGQESTPVPSSIPTATPSPSPTLSPSPSPSPTPSPTPIPVFEDLITETDVENLYNIPLFDVSGYFFNVHKFDDCLIYFYNETVETPPVISSYNISTGETKQRSFDNIDPYDYRYVVVPDKYIVVIDSKKNFTFFDKELNELYSFINPIQSEYREYIASSDYSKIYFIKDKSLIECSTSTGEETVLMESNLLANANPISLSYDDSFLELYIYSRKVGYSEHYYYDFERNELILPDASVYNFLFLISPDETEFVAQTRYNEVSVYASGDNLSDTFYNIYADGQLPSELLKTKIELRNETEMGESFIDWERHLLITVKTFNKNSIFTIVLTSYSLDTGKPFSSCAFPLEEPVYQPAFYSYDQQDGCVLISGSILKEPYCYAWNYTENTLKDESDGFVKYSYIPEFIDSYRKELEEKYNIFIYLGTEIFATEHDYSLAFSNDYEEQWETLNILDEVFSLYPKDILEQLKFDGIKTLGVYLCAGFTKKESYGIDSAIALAGNDGYERFMALDITTWEDIRRNIIHEFSHWLDKKLESMSDSSDEINFYTEWDACNPDNFYYMDDYNKSSPFGKYTYFYGSEEDAYFIDDYSLTKSTEDRARLFEYLMRYNGTEYFKSEHLRAKLHTYFDYIRKCYDTSDWPSETIWEHKLNLLDRMYSGDKTVTLEDIYPEYFSGDKYYSLTGEGYGLLDAYFKSYG